MYQAPKKKKKSIYFFCFHLQEIFIESWAPNQHITMIFEESYDKQNTPLLLYFGSIKSALVSIDFFQTITFFILISNTPIFQCSKQVAPPQNHALGWVTDMDSPDVNLFYTVSHRINKHTSPLKCTILIFPMMTGPLYKRQDQCHMTTQYSASFMQLYSVCKIHTNKNQYIHIYF